MNYQEIEKWLKDYDIENYIINDDLVVNINGSVDLCNKKLTNLPFRFGNVTGFFDCSCNHLTSLQYCPRSVRKDFNCSYNHLTILTHFPQSVGGKVYCFIVSPSCSINYSSLLNGDTNYVNNIFMVNEGTETSWLDAIQVSPLIYPNILNPTAKIFQLHKMLWEV